MVKPVVERKKYTFIQTHLPIWGQKFTTQLYQKMRFFSTTLKLCYAGESRQLFNTDILFMYATFPKIHIFTSSKQCAYHYCLDCMKLLFWLSCKAFRSVLSFRPPLHFSPFDDVNSTKSFIWTFLLLGKYYFQTCWVKNCSWRMVSAQKRRHFLKDNKCVILQIPHASLTP